MLIVFRPLLAVLIASHAVLLFADFIAPYSYQLQNRTFPLAPPSRLRFLDEKGRFHLRPFVFRTVPPLENGNNGYTLDRSSKIPLQFFVTGARHSLLGFIETRLHLFGLPGDSRIFLLGTDAVGRDEFSRLLYGGRISVFAGLLAASISLALGLLLGLLAGFYSSWVDSLIMRAAEIFLSVPWLYLLLSIRALVPLHIDAVGLFLLFAGLLGAIGWARPARLVRGVALSARERDYVEAASGFGASNFYLLRVHVLPSAASVAFTQAVVYIPQYVLAEVTLSFFGLGVSEPMPSWGNMLTGLPEIFMLQSCPWLFAPAVALVFISVTYFMLFSHFGDARRRI